MAEEVRRPEPQNPAVDPELPQPLVIPIIIRPESGSAIPVSPESDAGVAEATQFFGEPEVFQPVGVPLAADQGLGVATDFQNQVFPTSGFDPGSTQTEQERATVAALENAQQQGSIQNQYNQPTQRDWRVRISLLPGAEYLYKSSNPGILRPLLATDGVIFPYVPTINTNYQAKYDNYELTHSNLRGYFYRNSMVGDITVTGTFTAQNTEQAEYLLAVIHFFRSVTKMFYGQDPERGTPPPLVTLDGFGEYQFNNHTCLVSNFAYNLPNNVDYIRVTPNNLGLSLARRQASNSSNPFTISSVVNRILNAGLPRGAEPGRADLGVVNQTVSGTATTTYVPTRIDVTVTLLPVQTRSQVSQQFSLRNFANGNLLRGGFW